MKRLLWPLLYAATFVAYIPAIRGGLIWDDEAYVTKPELQSLHGLGRIWFELGATEQYYPLLHSAFWLQHRLWGDSPIYYHLLNVALHATAACLLVVILRRLALPGAWLAGFIFALHPVCVESVAWISEEKNTLSIVFYLLAALAYLNFDRERRAWQYCLGLLLFVFGLLSKSTTAILPAALLVVFWWRRGGLSWRRDIGPLAPWLGVGAASGLFSGWVERTYLGAKGAQFGLNGVERVLVAGRAVWFYLGKLLWPENLIFIYPRWHVSSAAAWQYAFPIALGALMAVFWLVRGRTRGPLAALLLFVGSLFPTLGFFNVYAFVFSYVADHWQYLASLAVIAPVAAGWAILSDRYSPALGRAGAAVLLAALGVLTWRQGRMYHDPITLYQTIIERNPDCWMAEDNLGGALIVAGRDAEAVPHLERGLQLRPDNPASESMLGDALNHLGRAQEAIPHLMKALQIRPRNAEAHNYLGSSLVLTGHPAEGIVEFQRALLLKPDYALARFNLGFTMACNGRVPEGCDEIEAAVKLEPDSADFRTSLGNVLLVLNRLPEAIGQYEESLRLDPGNADTHFNLALALKKAGRVDEANGQYDEAMRLRGAAAH
jgi:protein O-mannosyl-transferase